MAVESFSTVLPEDFENERTRLGKLLQSVAGGFSLPPAKQVVLTYVGSTNNIATAVYKATAGGATVATLTMTYVNAGAADDDKIASVTLS